MTDTAIAGRAAQAPPAMLDPGRWKALALLCIASFMVILDAQIVILALPSIEADLGFTPAGAQWVLSAYLLSFGGLLLLGGRSADLLGRRRMFVVGVVLFLISSLLCGLAWSGGVLVAARAVQGVSAAIMAPTALSIVVNTFTDAAERNKALGIWSGVGGLGATSALLVGGPVTATLGWEWIFFLNIPVAVGLLISSRTLQADTPSRGVTRSFDIAGAVVITSAAVLLVYALVEAPHVGWTSGRTLGIVGAAAVLAAAATRIEARAADPLVPLRILRSGTLTGGTVVMTILGTAAFGMPLVLSLYAQQVLGFSAITFGLGTIVMTVMAVLGSYAGQAMATRFRPGWVGAVGLALCAAGSLVLTQASVDGTYVGDILLGLLLFGPGLGACYVAASIATLTGVAESESGLASGINTAAFQLGGALGVAITATVVVSATSGSSDIAALNHGFQSGFAATAVLAAIGVLASLVLLRRTGSSGSAR